MDYIEFYIGHRCIITNMSIVHSTHIIPDRGTMFRASIESGLDIFVLAEPREEVGYNTYEEHLSIFDMGFTVRYWGSLRFAFSVVDRAKGYLKLLVETESNAGRSIFGTLEIWNDGMVKFNDRFIKCEESRRLWAKAALLSS